MHIIFKIPPFWKLFGSIPLLHETRSSLDDFCLMKEVTSSALSWDSFTACFVRVCHFSAPDYRWRLTSWPSVSPDKPTKSLLSLPFVCVLYKKGRPTVNASAVNFCRLSSEPCYSIDGGDSALIDDSFFCRIKRESVILHNTLTDFEVILDTTSQ